MPLTHTILLVADFERCLEFYRDGLGFQVVSGAPPGPFAVLVSGAAMIGLFDRAKRPPEFAELDEGGTPGPARFALAFQSEDVDGTFERLKARGVRFRLEPRDFPDWGYRSSLCLDPDGNPVEIYRPLAGVPQRV